MRLTYILGVGLLAGVLSIIFRTLLQFSLENTLLNSALVSVFIISMLIFGNTFSVKQTSAIAAIIALLSNMLLGLAFSLDGHNVRSAGFSIIGMALGFLLVMHFKPKA